jgi:iron complex outermembrane receptor protein
MDIPTQSIRRKSIATSVLSALVMASGVAQAQLEEVVVTAQKREENLQEVPIAITAVTAAGLDKAGITGSDELTVAVPNLQFSRQISSATPFMRGVGTKNSSVGDEGSISTYVDGVYYSSMVASVMEFNNIERVEVLRGPQGTLFGRNATGGLIHVITRDPQYETSGSLRLGVGSYDTYEASGYVTGGLSDTVAADLSLLVKDRGEGYGDNIKLGEERADAYDRSLRSKILWEVSDETQLLFSAMYAESKSDVGVARQPAPGTVATGGGTYTGDFQDIDVEVVPIAEGEQSAFSLKFSHSFESVELISLTAYTNSDSELLLDQESGPNPVVYFDIDQETDQFSQEFQLNSLTDGPFQWTAGLYFLEADASYTPIIVDIPASGQTITTHDEQSTTSYAAYFQGTYDFSENTRLTAGVRYTKDERELEGSTHVASIDVSLPFDGDESWTEPTWRLALDHQLGDGIMLFGSYSRGFKSGVYNTAVVDGQLPDPVEPEIIDAYEIGIKGDFLDDSLRLNATAFFYDYTGMQMQQILGGAVFLFNVADSEIYGAEFEANYFINENFDINFALALLESEYTDFPDGPIIAPDPDGSGNVQTFGDLSGNELIRAPEYSFNISANYRMPVSVGEMNFNVTYYYNDGFYWEPDNRTSQDDYDILNAEIGLTTADEKWWLRLYGRNLLDSDYSYYSQQSTFGDFVSAAPPLTWGISAEYRF